MIGPDKAADAAIANGMKRLAKDGIRKAMLVVVFVWTVLATVFNVPIWLGAASFPTAIGVYAIIFGLAAVLALAYVYYYIRFLVTVLQDSGQTVRDTGYGIKAMMVFAGAGLRALFLWSDKKHLVAFLAAIVLLAAAAAVGGSGTYTILLVPAILIAVAYFAAFTYHAVRLFGTGYLYILGRSFENAANESWTLAAGRTFQVFLFLTCIGVASGIAGAILGYVAGVLVGIMATVAGLSNIYFGTTTASGVLSKMAQTAVSTAFTLITPVFGAGLLLEMLRVRVKANKAPGAPKAAPARN